MAHPDGSGGLPEPLNSCLCDVQHSCRDMFFPDFANNSLAIPAVAGVCGFGACAMGRSRL